MKLFIHIGLPKTAVTTFSYLFETSNEINFLGRPLDPIYENIWQSMMFDNDKKYKKKLIRENQNILNSLSKKKVNILLIEGITDPLFSINKVDYIKRLKLLKDTLKPKVQIKILFVIRNQADFIFSRFIESPKFFQNYNKKWMNFEIIKNTFKKKKMERKSKNFYVYFNFYKICRELVSSFGKKNVNFLLYEQIKYEKKIFSRKLSNILGISYKNINNIFLKNTLNQSVRIKKNIFISKKYQLNNIIIDNFIYKKVNKKIPRNLKFLIKNLIIKIDKFFYKFIIIFLPNYKIEMNEQERYLIRKFFCIDNKKLEKSFKINLKKYNYY